MISFIIVDNVALRVDRISKVLRQGEKCVIREEKGDSEYDLPCSESLESVVNKIHEAQTLPMILCNEVST